MENPGIDGCCHQVVGRGDGVNVTSQMEVELEGEGTAIYGSFPDIPLLIL